MSRDIRGVAGQLRLIRGELFRNWDRLQPGEWRSFRWAWCPGAGNGASATTPGLSALSDAMLGGDTEAFEEQLEAIMVTMLSHHDLGGERVEAIYQAFIVGLLVHLQDTHRVVSNREAGFGRADVLVMPRAPGPGAVLDLKRVIRRETPEHALERAVTQLQQRDYAAEVRAAGATAV